MNTLTRNNPLLWVVDFESMCHPCGEEPEGVVSEIIEISAVLLDKNRLEVERIFGEMGAMYNPALHLFSSRGD